MTSIAVEGMKSNINNYKGVMLCTRPNENIGVSKERTFVSRVDPKEKLGLNPVKKIQKISPKKKLNPVLQRHRVWLESFKERMREKKDTEEQKGKYDKERFERIREQATIVRGNTQEIAEEYRNIAVEDNQNTYNYVQQEQASPKKAEEEKPTKSIIKKKENNLKPKWAYTEQQLVEEEDKDLDDLLKFTTNLDYDKYINDLEVKDMVVALKKRIDELRGHEEDDWKNKIVDAWNNNAKDERKTVQPSKVDLGYDARSDTRSVASEARSAASERTQKTIQELKSKYDSKERKEWDTMSTTTKKNIVSVEERIAKHVADEILRNNTEFRHFHSNASVRKILEKEAQKHMEDVKGIRAPEIVSNKEYFTRKDVKDPNNLPYLHRNPAI